MSGATMSAAPEAFEDWGSYFDDNAARYEESAFGSAGLAYVGNREVHTVVSALARRAPGRVLDAGAGTGRIARVLHHAGWHVTALDVSTRMLDQLRDGIPGCRTVHAALGDALPLDDATFDAVVSMRVLKYVVDLDAALAELARVVRPGGTAVFEFPNARSLARFGYGRAPIHFVTAGEAAARCRAAGFEIVEAVAGARLPQPVWARAARPRQARAVAAAERGLARILGGDRSVFGARSVILVGVRE